MRLGRLSLRSPVTLETKSHAGLQSVDSRGGWFSVVREGFMGAWQRNIEYRQDDVIAFHAVYASVTRIAADVAKLPIGLSIAFALLCIVVLVALPIGLYMLTSGGQGPSSG